jgi:hypothetical protein
MKVSQRHARARSILAALLFLTLPAAGPGGCMRERVVNNSFESFRRYAQSEAAGGGSDSNFADSGDSGASGGAGGVNYAIEVASYTGSDRQQQARLAMKKLGAKPGMTNLWQADIEGRTRLYRGKYRSRTSRPARAALNAVQRTKIEGDRPFAEATLVALNQRGKQIDDKHNLKAYSGAYSLQVGYFGPDFEGDRRAAAEKEAAAMRQAFDVPTFYYHGQHRSMVTLQIFSEEEAFTMKPDPISPGRTKVRAYAAGLRQLRQRFPRNFADKTNIAQRFKSENEYEDAQPSALVRIP